MERQQRLRIVEILAKNRIDMAFHIHVIGPQIEPVGVVDQGQPPYQIFRRQPFGFGIRKPVRLLCAKRPVPQFGEDPFWPSLDGAGLRLEIIFECLRIARPGRTAHADNLQKPGFRHLEFSVPFAERPCRPKDRPMNIGQHAV